MKVENNTSGDIKSVTEVDHNRLMNYIIKNPIKSFSSGVVFAFVLVTAYWVGIQFYLSNGELISLPDRLSNTSSLISAIIGTTVAFASAFVALVLASAATSLSNSSYRIAESSNKIAEAALQESRLSNKLNSPDYQAFKISIARLKEFSYLTDNIIYTYGHVRNLHIGEQLALQECDEAIANPPQNIYPYTCHGTKETPTTAKDELIIPQQSVAT